MTVSYNLYIYTHWTNFWKKQNNTAIARKIVAKIATLQPPFKDN